MKKLIILIGLLIGLGISQVATACTIVDKDNMQCLASYLEPTENTDGTLLTDLDHIVVYYKIGDQLVFLPAVPVSKATSPNGGGKVTGFGFIVPVAEGMVDVPVDFKLRAVAIDGRESEDSTIQSMVLSHPIPKPNAPVGLSIQ